jgi:hypothetical protein
MCFSHESFDKYWGKNEKGQTEELARVGSTSDVYLEGAQLKSHPGH